MDEITRLKDDNARLESQNRNLKVAAVLAGLLALGAFLWR